MTHTRILVAAGAALLLIIALVAATALFPGGPLSRKEMRLVDGFAAAYTACMDSAGDANGISLGDCNEAEILKARIDEAGLCIDYDNSRQDTYEDFYRCGSAR
ncbi:hypothetical protein PARHAE_04056 [Paracoccus haematequi]|uniref:Uncharacterized protein n=1 Tax=Paracoccus haematequi TaxID=2491866 RepID=A0A447ITI7_9RHOB|nr:hypothetical protein [Paracoccus haematequi]VDS10837.1 hypothetical protein PARHAE_04056 [Paracoccus haematequi]